MSPLSLKNGDTVTVVFAGGDKSLSEAVVHDYDATEQQWVLEAPIGSGDDVEIRTILVKNYEAMIVTKRAADQ